MDDDFYDSDGDDALWDLDVTECALQQNQSNAENESRNNKPSDDVLKKLNKFFGHKSFRPLQWEIIREALNGRDQLVVLSTGYGKSICYQMPSLIQENLTLVVSPLISLMNDQVTNARANGIKASCITGETSYEDRNEIVDACLSGELNLLYVTPEFGLNNDTLMRKISSRIGLLAIDEAHCVSQWGHEFRSDYRRLSSLRDILSDRVPVMALTATATVEVQLDIVKNLKMRNAITVCSSLDRSNLYLDVRSPTSLEGIKSLITHVNDVQGKHFGGPTIVYCSTRAIVEDVHKFLSGFGVKCAMYHAGLSPKVRAKAHENFMKDKVTTIVATVAFGMGIDKADVRYVIHYGAPRGIESYYQEIGRAGRDGFPSKCIGRLMRDNSLKEPYKTHAVEMQRHMETYLTGNTCRRFSLLSHFDPSLKRNLTPQAGCCDICDKNTESENDTNKNITLVDYTDEAEILLRSVEVFGGKSGLGKVIDFIKGKANVYESKQKHSLYGAGTKKTEVFWKELGRILRLSGYFHEQKSKYNDFAYTMSLSDKAERWLQANGKELKLEPTPALLGRMKVATQNGKTKYVSIPSSGDASQSRILGQHKQRKWKDCSEYDGLSDHETELFYSRELEKELMDLRTNLAIQMDCGAHMIASNKCIQQLTAVRPSCVENLYMISEMPEEKRKKFGKQLVEVCVDYCKKHSLPMDYNAVTKTPSELIEQMNFLAESNRIVYQSHVKQRLSLAALAQLRDVSESTIASYIVNCVKLGLPIHLDVLQITQSNIDTILETIRNHGSDIIRLKPIMERLPDGFIDYNRLKIIFALLEYEYGVEEEEENKGKEVEDSQYQRSPPVDWNSYRFDSALRSANFRTCSSQKADTVGSLSQPSSSSRTVDVSSANSSQPNAAHSSSTSTTSKRRLPQWMTSDVTAKLASQSGVKKQKKSNLFR